MLRKHYDYLGTQKKNNCEIYDNNTAVIHGKLIWNGMWFLTMCGYKVI